MGLCLYVFLPASVCYASSGYLAMSLLVCERADVGLCLSVCLSVCSIPSWLSIHLFVYSYINRMMWICAAVFICLLLSPDNYLKSLQARSLPPSGQLPPSVPSLLHLPLSLPRKAIYNAALIAIHTRHDPKLSPAIFPRNLLRIAAVRSFNYFYSKSRAFLATPTLAGEGKGG